MRVKPLEEQSLPLSQAFETPWLEYQFPRQSSKQVPHQHKVQQLTVGPPDC